MVVVAFVILLLGAQLSSAAAAPAAPVTLQDAIALARRGSPARMAAAAAATGATDAAATAGRRVNPLLDIRTENWTPSGSHSLPLDLWATLSQPLELGGKRDLRRALASAERDGAVADLDAVDRRLARDVAHLYLQVLRARELVETLAGNHDGVATVIQTLRARVDEGFVAESDLLRFEAEGARLDLEIARATLDLDRSLDALTATIGSAERLDASQLVTPDVVAAPALDASTIASAVARHPELIAASARVARAERAEALERARRLPDPAVTAGFKRTLGIGTVVAAVTTTVPLFDHNGVAVTLAAANVRAASAERDATRLRLTATASSLTRTAQVLSARAALAQAQLLTPAEAVRESARAAFREGTVDVLKLIDAERVYGEVRRTAIDLQLEAIDSAIEARLALGEDPLP